MVEDCDEVENIKRPTHPDNVNLVYVLWMAQESLSPETYEGFVLAYNQLIDNRHLSLGKITENA